MPLRRPPRNKISVSFVIRKPANQVGEVPIRGIVRWHGQELRFATGKTISEGAWDSKQQLVAATYPQHQRVNAALRKFVVDIETAFLTHSGPLGALLVPKAAMEAALGLGGEANEPTPVISADPTFQELHDRWRADNPQLAAASARRYRAIPQFLAEWRPSLRPSHVTVVVARAFQQRLFDLERSNSSIGNYFSFLRMCRQYLGLPPVTWLNYSGSDPDQLELTGEELLRLVRTEMPPGLVRMERDLWLLQCFTGRRAEEMRQIEPRNFQHVISLNSTPVPALDVAPLKGGRPVMVPLPPIAVRIGERYGWKLPKYDRRKRNSLIKRVAALAGLDRQYNARHISGKQNFDNWLPVSEAISTHTARHTCSSLLYQASGTGDRSLSRYVLAHAPTDSTDIYTKDIFDRVAPLVLAAWQRVLGDWYDRDPA